MCAFAENPNTAQQQLRGSDAAYDSDICHRYPQLALCAVASYAAASCALVLCKLFHIWLHAVWLLADSDGDTCDRIYRSVILDTRSSQQHAASGFCLSPAMQGEMCIACGFDRAAYSHCSVRTTDLVRVRCVFCTQLFVQAATRFRLCDACSHGE